MAWAAEDLYPAPSGVYPGFEENLLPPSREWPRVRRPRYYVRGGQRIIVRAVAWAYNAFH